MRFKDKKEHMRRNLTPTVKLVEVAEIVRHICDTLGV